jgi:hypothetical protein
MAKKPVKSAVKSETKPAKKSVSPSKPKAPSKSKAPKVNAIEKISEETLIQLRELNIEHALQADIQWCLGSYRSDKNPVGLYVMGERALRVLKAVRDGNPKLVSTKLIGDLEKALKDR